MHYNEFIGEVQHRLELPTEGEAVRATRVVLTALGERLGAGEAADLAGPLPMEVDRYLTAAESGGQFSYQEFLGRVAEGASVDEGDAHFYAQAVVALVADCVPEGEIEQARAQLTDDYDELFEFAEAGATPW
jgi:uncharacterized protein (DUF2267 family)